MILNGIHICLLTDGFGLYRLSVDGAAEHILIQLQNHLLFFLKNKGKCVVHILLCNGIAPLRQLKQTVKYTNCFLNHLFRSYDFYQSISGNNRHPKSPFNFFYIYIKLPADIPLMLCRNCQRLFN